MLGYLRRNKSLTIGLCLLTLVLLFAGVGRLVWDVGDAAPLSARPNLHPSWDHPLGTDRQARDLLAVMIVGTPKTLYIGLLAGIIGLVIGTALALTAAYYGGVVDAVIRGIVDIGLTIPPLLV
ncbi:MAG: peptide/nickel transport system permease protein, partial [Thermomicrobiales bacterium]|nr:peptide/nickel transport system permease protein [Thermomicrobiales bacterium]